MGQHILEIVLMLLGAAILGFLIGWFLRKNKISELQGYIAALEDKNNRLQSDYNKNEHLLIDCQTEKRKAEFEKKQIEKLLIDCEGKLTVSDIELAKNKIQDKPQKIISAPKTKTKSKEKAKTKADNLTKIEGIGPKIASILKDSGYETFAKLSKAVPEKIRELLLEKGGKRYSMHDPETWSTQAELADTGKWEELEKLQDELKGGRKK